MQTVSSQRKEIPLSELEVGQEVEIARFSAPDLELALLKMGVSCGNKVVFCQAAPLGDPVAFRVNGTKIAIRKKDAARIWAALPSPSPEL